MRYKFEVSMTVFPAKRPARALRCATAGFCAMAGLLLSANASAQTAQPAEQTAPTTAGPSVAGPSVASPSVANPPATSPDKAKTPDKTKTPASKTAPPKTAPPKTAPPKTAPPKTATPTATTKLLKAPPAPTGADASKAPAATAPLVLPAPVAIPDQPDLPTHKPAVPGAGVKFGQITAPTTPGIKPLAVPAPAEAVPDYVAPPPLAEQHNPAPAWTGEKPTQDRKTLAVAAKASDSVQLLFAAGSKDMPADLQERLSGLAARLEAQPAERPAYLGICLRPARSAGGGAPSGAAARQRHPRCHDRPRHPLRPHRCARAGRGRRWRSR